MTVDNTTRNEYMNFSIRLMSEDKCRLLRCGYLYWVPGLNSKTQNDWVYAYRFSLNRALRSEDSVWFDTHFCYANEDIIRLFGQREKPYLIGALLSSPEYWDEGYAFLEAELTECSFEHTACACASFLRKLVAVFDAILDGKSIKNDYAQFRVTLFGESEQGVSVSTLAPGEKGIYGLPVRRISSELGTLVVSNSNGTLFFSGNNLQVGMPAESRALYLLFLLHPEGIERKKLWRYQEELKKIYRLTSVELDTAKLHRSVEQLLKVHDARSRDNLKHCIQRCNHSIKQAIDDTMLCKPYLITKYANKRLAIPIAKKERLFAFPINI